MKAAQVGATEAGNNWIGFVIHHAPGPMLAVLPTVEMAKRTSRGRLDPLIAESNNCTIGPHRSLLSQTDIAINIRFRSGELLVTHRHKGRKPGRCFALLLPWKSTMAIVRADILPKHSASGRPWHPWRTTTGVRIATGVPSSLLDRGDHLG